LDDTKNLVAQFSRHELSSFISGKRDDRYFVKRLSVVEDQLRRCNDAADKTKNLIDLIMNIASLQASRAAVQESQLANATAASIKRVTILTFIYPPLTLASVRTARLDPSTDSDVHARACWA
jgi:Mg2+ and Co2+ transporter CorA